MENKQMIKWVIELANQEYAGRYEVLMPLLY